MINHLYIANIVSVAPEGDQNELVQPDYAAWDFRVLKESPVCTTGVTAIDNGNPIYTDELYLPEFPQWHLEIGAKIDCADR